MVEFRATQGLAGSATDELLQVCCVSFMTAVLTDLLKSGRPPGFARTSFRVCIACNQKMTG